MVSFICSLRAKHLLAQYIRQGLIWVLCFVITTILKQKLTANVSKFFVQNIPESQRYALKECNTDV